MTPTRQYKMNMPADVDAWASAQAEKNCRSKSAQIVFVLRAVMAAGDGRQTQTPAAGNENAARQGSAV